MKEKSERWCVFWRAPKTPIYRCEGVNGMGFHPILFTNVQKHICNIHTWVAMNHNHCNNHGIKTEASLHH